MLYKKDRTEIVIGDEVVVEGNVRGLVVCDFDKNRCLSGYEGWLTKEELLGGGTLSVGIMIQTKDLGMLHYADEDIEIVKDV